MWYVLTLLLTHLLMFLVGVILGDHYCLLHSFLSKLESLILKIKDNSKHKMENTTDDDSQE